MRGVAQRGILLACGVVETTGESDAAFGAATLRALHAAELTDHAVDAFHRLRDLTASARLLLRGAFDLLGDRAHLLAALHDELGAARLLRRGCGDLLHGRRDAADGVRHLLRALGLLHRGASDRAHHVRAL